MATNDTPRIYVACLAAYNNGKLHGSWIDVDSDVDTMAEQVQEMLDNSPEIGAEEYAIHDHENCEGLDVGEFSSLREIADLFGFIEDSDDEEIARAALDLACGDLDQARSYLENYAGSADSLADWAEQFADDTGMLSEIPENLRYYFDFQSYARDLECGGDVTTAEVGGIVHVFWNQ